jgi:hypothetical protein
MGVVLGTGYDLPPKWDHRVVEWSGWEDALVFICPPTKPSPCDACGSRSPRSRNRGKVYPLSGETFTVERVIQHRLRSGRFYETVRDEEKRAWAVWRLFATRCPDCRADRVYDADTGEWYDLDGTDYGPNGSVAD